ncbi:MAG: hypothetical protein KJP10_04745, partial [Gammaproteobacteria bacterium]|nr:hypothetical protein [Gammaproteobacteria bacterium]
QAPCDMHESASHEMGDHSMHMMHQMDESAQVEIAVSHDCCDSATHCGSDCGININVSFITQSVFALPALKKAAIHTSINSNLVFRELAPPIRPPAHLQI